MNSQSPDDLSVRVIEDEREFLALRDAWNDLLHRSRTNTFFMTYEWLSTWWKYYREGRSLFIIIVEKAGEIICLAPLMVCTGAIARVPVKSLEFIGKTLSEKMDFIILDHEKVCFELIADLLRERAGRWNMLVTACIPSSSPTAVEFAKILRAAGFYVGTTVVPSPVADCDGSYDDYLGKLTGNERSNLKKAARRVRKAGNAEVFVPASFKETKQAIERMFAIDDKSRKADLYSSHHNRLPWTREFLREVCPMLHEKGWLFLRILELDGSDIAYLLCFRYNGEIIGYETAYDSRFLGLSPGYYLLTEVIREAHAEGARRLDMLPGGGGLHKASLSTSEDSQTTHRAFPPGVRGFLSYLLEFKLGVLLLNALKKVRFLKKGAMALLQLKWKLCRGSIHRARGQHLP